MQEVSAGEIERLIQAVALYCDLTDRKQNNSGKSAE